MNFVDQIKSANLDEEPGVKGISEAEISELESLQRVERLPRVYREYLRQCGRSAGLFARDSDYFYPAIKGLKDEFNEMLDEEGIDFCLPVNAFVFAAYQGCQYRYFLCDGSDDPAVYLFTIGGRAPVLTGETFSGLFLRGVSEYKNAFFDE